ncbi:sterol desaturase family protein [uncultured Microbulbifer sp.]|uniref:sterol desaturase family protein n=1 Tax=uncultured Microbulbifer sp. TaxID=348147 RepID=UPI002612D893|nr:sterol desaturase family protein [uncultured Microbulbifer sp.]
MLISLTAAVYCILHIRDLKGGELLVIPLGILAYNAVEYVSHRWAGHKKLKLTKLFYRRHTGDHHSFFSAPQLSFESAYDWRIVLFPTYLTAFVAIVLAPFFGFCLTWLVSVNVGYLMAATMILNHLAYELLHIGYHQPIGGWFHRVPGLRELAHLHRIHHHRKLMKTHNFNLTFPLFDLLLGTLYWEPLDSFDDFCD